MPIQLPQDPTNGQQVTTGGKTYLWNGRFWKNVASTSTGGVASYAISATAPNPATYPIWFTLTGDQFVWDGEAWLQVHGAPGADGQPGAGGTGSSQSAILSWAI